MSLSVADTVPFVQSVLLVDEQAFAEDVEVDEAEQVHPVEAREIVDALADEGIACAVLAPGGPDDPDRERVVRLAAAADVLVLDWTFPLEGGKPRTTMPILEALFDADLSSGAKLRLVIVYTGWDLPQDVIDDVDEALLERNVPHRVNDFDVVGDNLRVLVIGKPESRAHIEKRSGEDLARSIPKLFSDSFADGLLRRVALAGVATVRSHAHELLTRFPADVDRSYLSHRALTGPLAAEGFARQLVVDELSNLLADFKIEQWVDQDHIDHALHRLLPPGQASLRFTRKARSKAETAPAAEMQKLLSKTAESVNQLSGRKASDLGSVTEAFYDDPDDVTAVAKARRSDEAFTILSTFHRTIWDSNHLRVPPTLRLGTILRMEDYWLCMQPLCDGARLSETEETLFPLAPLKPRSDSDTFDLVVPIAFDGVRRFSIDVHLKALRLEPFRPSDRGEVRAHMDEARGTRSVVSARTRRFEWIGQLRLDHSHRFAALLGTSAGRIGLDEPEWSRRRSGRS